MALYSCMAHIYIYCVWRATLLFLSLLALYLCLCFSLATLFVFMFHRYTALGVLKPLRRNPTPRRPQPPYGFLRRRPLGARQLSCALAKGALPRCDVRGRLLLRRLEL